MKVLKNILLLISTIILVIAPLKTDAAVTFKDLASNHPQYPHIMYLANKNVIEGYEKSNGNYFSPNKNITRAEATKMIVAAKGYKPSNVSKSRFTDVTEKWMIGYIEKAAELGYIDGVSETKFQPNEPITREQMSKIISIAFAMKHEKYKGETSPFKDVQNPGDYYYSHTLALYYNGIIEGLGNGEYGVRENVTRAHMAAFLARAMDENFRLKQQQSPLAETDAVGQIASTTDGLNVRTGPTTSASSKGKINKGDKLLAYGVENDWVKVAYQGKAHYVSKAFVKFLDVNGNAFDLSNPTTKKVAKEAKVYRGANTSTKVIATIKAGESVTTYRANGDFTVVAVSGIPGYVLTSSFQSNEQPNVSNKDVSTIGIVTANSLNIRASESDSSTIIGQLAKGTTVEVISINGWWAKIKYGNQTGYIHKTYLKLKNTSGSPLQNRIIVLDPGHGGKDSGAVNGTTYEKNIVLDVGLRVKALLENAGAKVVMTRSTDVFVDLYERPKIAERNFGEIFISLHINAGGGLGTETYYSYYNGSNIDEEKTLSKYINNEIVKNLNMKDRGVKTADYVVIKNIEMPAILIELGFIDRAEDLVKLKDSTSLQLFAQSIYNGIEKYYQN